MKQMNIDSTWMEKSLFQLMWFLNVKVQKANSWLAVVVRFSAGYTQVYREYPLIFQSVLCILYLLVSPF